VLLIVAGVIVGVGAIGLAALIVWRWHRYRHPGAARAMAPFSGAVLPLRGVARAAHPLPKPQPALERPPDIHLHLHGVSAGDIAALLARHEDGPA
jgi:hypothetical protein